MINKFIDLLKEYNEILKSKIATSKSSEQINSVLSRLGKEPVSEEEIEMLYAEISKLDLEEESRKRIPFIIFLLKNNKDLDEDQNAILYSISRQISLQDTSSIESLIEKNNKVIDELSNKKIFENMEDLIIVFNELESSEEITIDNKLKLDFLKEIIVRNIENASMFEVDNVEESDTYPVDYEIEVSDDKKMSDEELKELLEKYDYSYDALTKDNKKYLSKYATKERITEVLDELERIDIYIKFKSPKYKEAFCKIIVLSSADAIRKCLNLCNKHGISITLFVEENPSVLIPNTVQRHKHSIRTTTDTGDSDTIHGVLGNFEENLEYLSERGYDITEINRKRKDALTINPYIMRHNLETLETLYGISMKDGKAFSAVMNGTAIENLDRLIESSPKGFEYARVNKSKISIVLIPELMKIRIAEAQNCSLFYERGDQIVKFGDVGKTLSNSNSPIDKKRIQVLKMSDSDVIRAFGQDVPVFLSDDVAAEIDIVLRSPSEIRSIDVEDNIYIKYLDDHYKLKDENGNESEFVYKINSTLISRMKVLRICQALKNNGIEINEDIIKYVISYNSILNKEDVENISSIDFGFGFGGR